MTASTGEHPSISHFRAEHARRGGTGEIVVLPEAAHTAALAAAALGCEVGAIANSLLFEARTGDPGSDSGAGPVLVLTSGAHRVDVDLVAGVVGVDRLVRADPAFVRAHTGQVIGGVSPLAHPTPVPTYVDTWLRRHDVVWAAAGHPSAVFATSHDELVALTGGTSTDVARPEGS